MILATLVIGAIALFICFVYIKPMTWRVIGTLLSLVLLITSLVMINKNDHDHYGMHKVTTTETKKIYSADATGKMGLLLYQPIGSKGTENVQIYATKPKQKTPGHTQPNEFTTNKVKRTSAAKATLKTTETRWQYNKGAKIWFGISGNNNKLIKRVNTFTIPNNWIHITTKQATTLKKKMAKMQTPAAQAQTKQQAEAYVKTKMQAAAQKDPSIMQDQAKQAKLSKQFAAEFQANMIKQAIK
ncbi:DUF4811 domain-containing protein [Furfurilactobacillus siliginis]|uniref:DUF4811 domain-containing protein n=1 Tax=Furfurilactobacillus siliginis TaxID=348151 RepID=A0A0R2LB76_9LACO|nr:DUF4811 domain-containing protein [Furfurilactobacillus siliginis]KRN96330.1 hypothetical protein IV55_GL001291 [Furfurilactobacillus siliginis]GEK29622.1 DUF4811 domain-containing protein [Furfurilactobacillus siliginis]